MRFAGAASMKNEGRFKRDEATVIRDFWGKFTRLAAHIPFAEDLFES